MLRLSLVRDLTVQAEYGRNIGPDMYVFSLLSICHVRFTASIHPGYATISMTILSTRCVISVLQFAT